MSFVCKKRKEWRWKVGARSHRGFGDLKMVNIFLIWSYHVVKTSQPPRSVARNGFVDNFLYKQMAFLFHNNYCFYFQNIWIQWRMCHCVHGRTNFCDWVLCTFFPKLPTSRLLTIHTSRSVFTKRNILMERSWGFSLNTPLSNVKWTCQILRCIYVCKKYKT